jgi:hypothetical protein
VIISLVKSSSSTTIARIAIDKEYVDFRVHLLNSYLTVVKLMGYPLKLARNRA